MNRTDGRRARLVGVLVLALVVATVTAGVLIARGLVRRARLVPAPLAVVLIQTARGSELVTIDLPAMRVVRRTRLRSLCLSIAAIPTRRAIVTAQCGGPDRSADTAAGIYAADSGRIEYVDLGVQNPLDVAATRTFALLVHGLERDGRLVTSLVDVGGRYRVRHGWVGTGALKPEPSGSKVVVPEVGGVETGPTGGRTARLVAFGADESRSASPTFAADWCRIVCSGVSQAGRNLTVTRRAEASSEGPGSHGRGPWRLTAVQPSSRGPAAEPASVALPPLEHGCADACLWRGMLAVADADGIDMADPGDTIRIFDTHTGGERMRLRLSSGMPAALDTWEDHLLVVDGVSGDLLVFDAQGGLEKRISLGGVPVGTADLAVIR